MDILDYNQDTSVYPFKVSLLYNRMFHAKHFFKAFILNDNFIITFVISS